MTARWAIILLLIGSLVFIMGGLFKFQHWPLANFQLMVGSFLQAFALVVIAVKALRYPGFKDFLDS